MTEAKQLVFLLRLFQEKAKNGCCNDQLSGKNRGITKNTVAENDLKINVLNCKLDQDATSQHRNLQMILPNG